MIARRLTGSRRQQPRNWTISDSIRTKLISSSVVAWTCYNHFLQTPGSKTPSKAGLTNSIRRKRKNKERLISWKMHRVGWIESIIRHRRISWLCQTTYRSDVSYLRSRSKWSKRLTSQKKTKVTVDQFAGKKNIDRNRDINAAIKKAMGKLKDKSYQAMEKRYGTRDILKATQKFSQVKVEKSSQSSDQRSEESKILKSLASL